MLLVRIDVGAVDDDDDDDDNVATADDFRSIVGL